MSETVVVAMSGGVDSSVAAALLVEQGYRVIGMMLRLWTEDGREAENRCCTPDAVADARRVSARLDIPFYVIDGRQRFRETVVEAFLEGYSQGVTPNPCIVCNQHMRWGFLMAQARAFGGDYLATGHYARVVRGEDGVYQLLRGRDERKDQSYVLSALTQEQLSHTLLPLGGLEKPEVRELARKYRLSVAERAESQDLCFLGSQDYRDFLKNHAAESLRPGPMVNRQGEVVGEHGGLPLYTIGQRKGLGIAAAQPLYVLAKDLAANTLVVGTLEELGQREMQVAGINWINGQAPQEPLEVEVKIRYKAQLTAARLTPLGESRARVEFENNLRDITPGQRAVFYNKDMVLGGGMIQP